MKFSIICALVSISTLAAAGVLPRTDAVAKPKKNSNHPRDAITVRGGDVVVLQGKGGRDGNNNIIIVDNSFDGRKNKKKDKKNKDKKNKDNTENSGSGLANIIVIQGSNSFTMVDGRVNGQSNSIHTVTVTMTSTVSHQTNTPGTTTSSSKSSTTSSSSTTSTRSTTSSTSTATSSTTSATQLVGTPPSATPVVVGKPI